MSPKRRNLPRFILSGSAAAILTFTSTGHAVENLWTGATNNDWNTPTNWSLGRVPTNINGQPTGDPFDDAVINSSTNFPVITADLVATPRNIVVGSGSGSIGRVDHRTGMAVTEEGGLMVVGRDGGTGTYNLANTAGTGGILTGFGIGTGSLNIGGKLYVGGLDGVIAGTLGTFNVNTSGTVSVVSDLVVGSAGGTGLMNVDAGEITTGGWNFIGKNEGITGANGTLKMSGGFINNTGARTFIGLGDSTGTFQMSGGTYDNMAGGVDTFFAIGVNNLANPTTPTLTMTGGTINSARVFTIGGTEAFGGNPDGAFVGSGKGAATVNGEFAQLNSFGEFWVGQGVGSTGELTLNAGAISVSNWVDIGRFGATGRVNMTGGTFTKTGDGHFLVGDGAGANGTLNLSGGAIALNSGELWVGQNGATGTFSMSGGTLNVGSWTAIGRTGGNGTMNLSGGIFTKTGPGSFIVADPTGSGRVTTGVVNQSGDSVLFTNELWVGQGVGGNGTYKLSGGTVSSTGWIAIGREAGTGLVEVSGTGALVKEGANTSNLIVGSLSGNGTVKQTGGSVTVNPGAGSILMGEGNSNALWDISGGTVSTDAFVVGWRGGTNELRVSGTGSVTGGFINVGEASGGKAIVNQSAGTITSNQWIAVGIGSAQQAEYNLSGGTTNAVGFEVGADSSGIVRLSGTGVMNISGNVEVPTRNGAGRFDITGGTVNTSNFFQGGRDGNTAGSGVTNQSGGRVNISGDLVVQRAGVGTGTYNLSGGILAVDGVIQASLGTFTFTGGKITRSTPGTIAFNGNLTTGAAGATLGLDADKSFEIIGALNNTAGLTLELTGLAIPDQPSLLQNPVTGSFALGSILTVPEAGAFNIGRTFDIGFDSTFFVTGQGFFTATRINEDAPFNPLTQSVYWLDEDDGVVALKFSIIPEPGSAALLSIAGMILASRRRRRRS